ncbi:ribose-phosphate pyrophosphokinase family protein [Pseudomonas phage PHB09]|uniref:Ribose-phosphate pyrophosphokinase family protein n=1 Tax=Pseudomonas phage PHB09 TaxID=2867265 RepID=A0AAE8XC74_9CAUD|nr:ribose-phosphate pyrophosphokinase family protein [Pseudomonas phage PHB09]UAV84500.1 ribose-phosphate pyrophosphokinase family protein [Pseudomonas phage PHB09]
MIKYKIEDMTTNVTVTTRKGGEVNVDINVGSQLPYLRHGMQVLVMAHLNTPEMQVALSHVMDALRYQFPGANFVLEMDYVPYGRQDRRCNAGEALGIKVFGAYINAMDFDAVMISDPHSDVTGACIERVEIIDQVDIFGKVHNFGAGWYIVAPDMGAKKKAEKFARETCAFGVITCYKERDMHTGEITSQGIIGAENVPKGAKLFVLDDICDGGRTFVGVRELLEQLEPETVELAVTHGIFSYGTHVVAKVFDRVYTTASWNPELKSEGNIEVVPL